MAEYKSIQKAMEIGKAVTRALKLAPGIGENTDKGLSGNDYTNEEKFKFSNIEDESNKTVVSGELGNPTTKIMSQNAVSRLMKNKMGIDSVMDIAHGGTGATVPCEARDNLKIYGRSEINKKLRLIPIVTQETGESTDKVISQLAVTNELDSKVDKIKVKHYQLMILLVKWKKN